jgi:CRISPR-associated endonuclease Csn1
MAYRLGLDIWANSIGWCALTLDSSGIPVGILGLGVRVYPDGPNPKDSTSPAPARRASRAMRRNPDRNLQRRKALLNALTPFWTYAGGGGSPAGRVAMDPYALRAAGLERRLAPEELGRLIHGHCG